MDYEKKYKEALEWARKVMHGKVDFVLDEVLEKFPELKESEDERIRKELIEFVRNRGGFKQEWISWLEKQGETSHILSNSSNIGKDEQKPAWSEDDQSNFNELSSFIFETYRTEDASRLITWLESLKDRVLPQPKQEWSDEDENVISLILSICNDFLESFKISSASTRVVKEDVDKIENWLKSLRPQKCLIPSEEEIEKAAQEWDSKANFNPFYMTMDGDKPTGVKQDITTHKESFKAGVNWILKSLRHQPQWKPSDRQMKALGVATNIINVPEKEYIELEKLYQDLEKLREEDV